ncbi:MAG: hypothetical protein AB8B65_12630 [Kordia sp.]|uniref:hypothetical protein n=1 Tax=Kordia sp. TaxID=1965332 RepID=UPI00385EFE02
MVIDIIDDQYFQKTRLRKIIYKTHNVIIIVTSAVFLIDLLFSLDFFQPYFFIFFGVPVLLLLIISILDAGLFIRTGTLEFIENRMIITNENIINEIDLRTIEKIQLKKVGREMFVLKVKTHEILIELTYHNKLGFKNILKQYNVKIDISFFGIKI